MSTRYDNPRAAARREALKAMPLDERPRCYRCRVNPRTPYSGYCQKCIGDRQREAKLGITTEQYDEMLRRQGGVCKICRLPESAVRGGKVIGLAVDHDHVTGVVRGLLCTACNVMLGRAGDNRETLLRAVRYLRGEL